MRFLFPSLGILFVLLLFLKLTHVVAWSWWWITAPLIVSILVAVVLIVQWAEGDKP